MKEDGASQIEVIGALRGFAALSVAWFHFTNGASLVQGGWLKVSGTYGWLGVEIFFVISGFIIPFSLYRADYRFPSHIGRFLLKRVIRLDPPYFLAILIAVGLSYAAATVPGFKGPPPSYEPIQLFLHLGYANAFFGYPWVIAAFWTLAIEFQFYVLISVLFPLISHTSASVRLCTLFVMCGSAFVLPHDAFAFHYMGLFAMGVLTFSKYVGLASARFFLLALVPSFAITVMSLGIPAALAGLLTALVIAFVRMPRFAPLTFVGAISYSVYLLHVPIGGRVVNLGSRLPQDAVTQIAVLAAAMCMTMFAAYLMFRFVERPARDWSSSMKYR